MTITADSFDLLSGVDYIRFFADEEGGANRHFDIGSAPGPGRPGLATARITWAFPACVKNDDKFRLTAQAVDFCGHVSAVSRDVKVVHDLATCFASSGMEQPNPGLVWTSQLDVSGGKGQMVLNGADAVFTGPGRSQMSVRLRRGQNRVEAVLVEAGGQPGLWRFDLERAGVRPGSLRVIAGEVAQVGATAIAFRLRGRAGERLVFLFAVE